MCRSAGQRCGNLRVQVAPSCLTPAPSCAEARAAQARRLAAPIRGEGDPGAKHVDLGALELVQRAHLCVRDQRQGLVECAGLVLPADRVGVLAEMLNCLDACPDLRSLTAVLGP